MIAAIGAGARAGSREAAVRRPGFPLAMTVALLLLVTVPACRRGAGGSGRGGAQPAASPRDQATGGCLGPFCLGHRIADAERPAQAAAITTSAPPAAATCWRFDQVDVVAFTDPADAGATIRGALATALPFCGAHPALASTTRPDVVDCRGVRLGDPAAFVTKMHRQARPVDADTNLWPEAPEGVTGLSDICTPGADNAHRTVLYLKDERVVGIGIGRR